MKHVGFIEEHFSLLHIHTLPLLIPLIAITDGETDMSGLLLVKFKTLLVSF